MAYSKGEYYTDRERYVNGLTLALSPLRDFGLIRYGRFYSTDEEYVKVADMIGNSVFLNVTAMSKAEILKDVARVILQGDEKGIVPRSLVTDKNEMRHAAPLFR